MLKLKKYSRIANEICSFTYWSAELSYGLENCIEDIDYIHQCINNVEYNVNLLTKYGVSTEIIKKCASIGWNWRTYFNTDVKDLFKDNNIMEYID